MCVGSLYAWSGFNIPIETRIFGENRNAAGVLVDRNISSVTFYVAVGVFGITTAFFGPVLERRGPRFGAVFGSILFFVAHLISSLGVQVRQIGLVYIGYGLFGGIGLGMCYISPVSPLQKWFIERRGAAAGLAVCGFGAGSILAPFLQKWAITALGLPLAFVFIGSIYFVVMSISALVLRMPPPNYIVDGMSIDTIKGASPHTPLSM